MLRHTPPRWRAGVHSYPTVCSLARVGVHAALATVCLGGAACTRAKPADPAVLRGVELPMPIARPAFRLTDTKGQPYDFAAKTTGRVTFLFFGYTHCPDVCPVHMSNLATVLRTLDYEQRQKIAVVFVTADPERDTPDKLRAWLDAFDPSFVGLRGTEAEVDSVQTRLGLAPAIRYPKEANGSYAVGHAGQIIVFQSNDTARVVYPFGTRQTDWLHDLPFLIDTAPLPLPQAPAFKGPVS